MIVACLFYLFFSKCEVKVKKKGVKNVKINSKYNQEHN